MRQINLVLNTEDLKEAYEKICNFLQKNFTMMPYSFRQFAYLLGGRSNLVRIDLQRAELEIRKNGKTILNAKLTKNRPGMKDYIDDMARGRLPRF